MSRAGTRGVHARLDELERAAATARQAEDPGRQDWDRLSLGLRAALLEACDQDEAEPGTGLAHLEARVAGRPELQAEVARLEAEHAAE